MARVVPYSICKMYSECIMYECKMYYEFPDSRSNSIKFDWMHNSKTVIRRLCN